MNNNFIESIIDWEKYSKTVDHSKRMKGVTKENIELEVQIWNQHLTYLKPLNEKEISNEIAEWKIELPDVNSFEEIAKTYTRLVNYKTRIGFLISLSRTWKDTCESAISFLEDLAPGAFEGTGTDKKANAQNIVQPFVHLRSIINRTDNYLTKTNESIVFCSVQLDLLLKEKQSRAKLNLKLSHSGEAMLISNITETNIEDEIEENGEFFRSVVKKQVEK